MRNCQALIKAIDAYIAKADGELENALSSAGFAEPNDTMGEIISLEDKIAQALLRQTRLINQRLEESVDLADFVDGWQGIKDADITDDELARIFLDSFNANMPKLATSYVKQIDSALAVTQMTKRTVDWAKEWSAELGKLMKLTTHDTVERLLVDNLRDGKGVAEFTRQLMDEGIRDEYHRARSAALTETLRAHSVAQQEAIIQNPACEDKEWVHTGEYRNKPRQNHVDMDGETARKDQPFTLVGANGTTYYPMYPRDASLPASESINCHCIHRGIASSDVLGLSLEERKALQERAIAEDDGAWERELDAKNRARAGIDNLGVYNPSGMGYNRRMENMIVGTVTGDGDLVSGITNHFFDRTERDGVSLSAGSIVDALQNPLHITPVKLDKYGRQSQKYIGRHATVVYNPETHVAVSTWKTGTDTIRKYGGDD